MGLFDVIDGDLDAQIDSLSVALDQPIHDKAALLWPQGSVLAQCRHWIAREGLTMSAAVGSVCKNRLDGLSGTQGHSRSRCVSSRVVATGVPPQCLPRVTRTTCLT